MNGRRWSLLLVAVTVTGVGVWIALHTYWDYVEVDNPPQGEAIGNRYYAFEKLGQKLAIHTRQVPTLQTLPAADGVLFVDDVRGALLDIDALEKWVAGGGRLLVSPGALLLNARLRSWSGIGRAATKSDDENGAARPTGTDDDCVPYAERVAGRETGKHLRACFGVTRVAFSSMRTPAWSLSNGYGFQMLRVRIGKGSIAVTACECLLFNTSLLRGDNARIVFDSTRLKAGDQVYILNPVTAESLLALLWRLAAAAISCALIALGLAIWRNLPRFGRVAVSPPPLRRSLAEQIRATARFAWRNRRLASLRLAERQAVTQAACRRLLLYERMDATQRIHALAASTGFDASALRNALSDPTEGSAESQRTAIALLEKVRRRLSL